MIRKTGQRRRVLFMSAVYSTAVALTAVCAAFTPAEEIFTPLDVAKLRAVSSAHISPDGRHVAYTLSVPRMPMSDDNGPAWSELHLVDADGNSLPYVTGEVNVGGVTWTPDSRGVAFIAKRSDDEHDALYVIPREGGEARRMVAHKSDMQSVAYNHDGSQIAFLATEPIDEERQKYIDKGFDQKIYEEDWRPTKVWIAAADGSGQPRALDLTGSAYYVQWNPAGRQLVVVMAPTPSVDDGYMFKRVFVVDADNGRVVEEIANPGKLGQVGWSPDGRRLAMISGVDIHDPAEGRLMVVDVPGDKRPRDLMPEYQAHVNSFVWQGANKLLWVADEGALTTVGAVTVAGERKVLDGPDLPIYSGATVSADGGRVALVGDAPRHPSEVFLMDESGDRAVRLTTSNAWLDEKRFARQEVIRHTARDGLELEGVLVYPLNYREGRAYPLILTVHGGPESHVADGWVTRYSYPGQLGAARGFAVFYPNYRGSTGRGVEFSMMGQEDAAGKEFDDLVDAVDHLVTAGIVQRDKVGITGGSYGGYASAWGATYYSDRFAASVMFVGISDNISKVGTTDIPEEMFLVHHRKRLWDDWEYFRRSSPINYLDRHRTPILILHGAEDPRVHPSQSLELFRHLKTLGQAPARLVLYPGEGHGNRRAAARFDYNVRLMRWMEHYLQGPGGDPPAMDIDYSKWLGDAEAAATQ